MRKIIFVSLAVLLLLSIGFSQTGQVGSIRGTVVDETNVALPGVAVTISSPSLVVPKMSRVTSFNGAF